MRAAPEGSMGVSCFCNNRGGQWFERAEDRRVRAAPAAEQSRVGLFGRLGSMSSNHC